jgi:hypothetical protein
MLPRKPSSTGSRHPNFPGLLLTHALFTFVGSPYESALQGSPRCSSEQTIAGCGLPARIVSKALGPGPMIRLLVEQERATDRRVELPGFLLEAEPWPNDAAQIELYETAVFRLSG